MTTDEKVDLALAVLGTLRKYGEARIAASEAEIRDDLRERIEAAGERLRKPYDDPLDEGDVGAV